MPNTSKQNLTEDKLVKAHELRMVVAENLNYIQDRDGRSDVGLMNLTVHTPGVQTSVGKSAIGYYRKGEKGIGIDAIQALSDALNLPRYALLIPKGAQLFEATGAADLLCLYQQVGANSGCITLHFSGRITPTHLLLMCQGFTALAPSGQGGDFKARSYQKMRGQEMNTKLTAQEVIDDMVLPAIGNTANPIEHVTNEPVRDYTDADYDAERKLTNGKVKNTLTGDVYEPTSRHRDEFDRNLGRNK